MPQNSKKSHVNLYHRGCNKTHPTIVCFTTNQDKAKAIGREARVLFNLREDNLRKNNYMDYMIIGVIWETAHTCHIVPAVQLETGRWLARIILIAYLRPGENAGVVMVNKRRQWWLKKIDRKKTISGITKINEFSTYFEIFCRLCRVIRY